MVTRSYGGKRSGVVAFIAVLALSSVTMLLLLWRFPIGTLAIAGLVIGLFWIATRLARSLDIERLSDRKRRDQRI